MAISRISDNYAVAAQILPDEIPTIAEQGFVTVICNRPDGEEPGQPSVADIAAACKAAGMSFHHVPVSGIPIPADTVAEHRRLVDESQGPVLAYCRSGQRSLVIWQTSA